MSIRTKNELRNYFYPAAVPLATQFHDVIDSCSNLSELNEANLELNGTITLDDRNPADTRPLRAGTIRWDGTNFQGFDGTAWINLDGAGGGGPINDPLIVGAAQMGSNGVTNGLFSHSSGFPGFAFGVQANALGTVSVKTNPTSNIRFLVGNDIVANIANGPGTENLLTIGNGANRIELGDAGTAAKDSGGLWAPLSSDFRVKEKVKDFEPGLEQLEQLKPVSFEYNGKGNTQKGKKDIGFIAQEVGKVFPEAIISSQRKMEENDETPVEVLSYDPNVIYFTLINAVKQLHKKVEQLEAQLASI